MYYFTILMSDDKFYNFTTVMSPHKFAKDFKFLLSLSSLQELFPGAVERFFYKRFLLRNTKSIQILT